MKQDFPFEIRATGTEQLILQATYHALLEYGYAELTISRIGEHFTKTNSLIYEYYDSKDELLIELLQQLLSQLRKLSVNQSEDAHEQLLAAVRPRNCINSTDNSLVTATLILRAQAPHSTVFRQEFQKLDNAYMMHICKLIELGIEQGVYIDINQREVAEYLYSVMTGADFITATTGSGIDTATVSTEIEQYLQARLLTD